MKNIIFDMGNVLLTYAPEKYLRRNFSDEKTISALLENVFNSDIWFRCDGGEITVNEAEEEAKKRLPDYQSEVSRLFSEWHESLEEISGMYELVSDLKKQGYKLFLLSNTNLQFREFSKRYPVFKLFDGLLISAEEKCLKPSSEIFEKLLQKFSLSADESVFIDDMPENTAAAETLGLKAITFTGAEALKKELEVI